MRLVSLVDSWSLIRSVSPLTAHLSRYRHYPFTVLLRCHHANFFHFSFLSAFCVLVLFAIDLHLRSQSAGVFLLLLLSFVDVRLFSVHTQTEPPSQQHVRIQKELWRIQDVMEALNKHKAQRNALDGMGFYGPKANFSKHKNEVRHHL